MIVQNGFFIKKKTSPNLKCMYVKIALEDSGNTVFYNSDAKY